MTLTTKERIAVGLSLLFIVFLLFAPGTSPRQVDMLATLRAPSAEHWLGTDHLGRDLLTLMKHGCIRTLLMLFSASVTGLIIGVSLGLLAGYFDCWWSRGLVFMAEIVLTIPTFILALIITALLGLTPVSAGFVLGFSSSGHYIVQISQLVKEVKERPYIELLHKTGISHLRIIFRHVWVNILPVILTSFGNQVSNYVLDYAGLTFIGLGTDPTQADWGTMLYQYRLYLFDAPWLVILPCLGIFCIALVFHILFDRSYQSLA